MPPVVHPISRHTSAPQTLTTQLCSSLIIVLDLMMVRNGWAHGISKAVPLRSACRCCWSCNVLLRRESRNMLFASSGDPIVMLIALPRSSVN